MLDISAYNAFVLWTSIDAEWMKNSMYKRRIFLEKLGFSLIEQQIVLRSHLPRTDESRSIVKSIKEKYQESHNALTKLITELNQPAKRARCKFCVPKNDNKTSLLCSLCNKNICKNHVVYHCPDC